MGKDENMEISPTKKRLYNRHAIPRRCRVEFRHTTYIFTAPPVTAGG